MTIYKVRCDDGTKYNIVADHIDVSFAHDRVCIKFEEEGGITTRTVAVVVDPISVAELDIITMDES